MDKLFSKAEKAVSQSAKKFTNCSVGRGLTAYPKTSKELENLGLRWDFDGEVQLDGKTFNKFQIQPNAGKVPSSIRQWREANGGTHAVMGSMYVEKGGPAESATDGFKKFREEFKK